MVTWKRQLTHADTQQEPENRPRTALMLGAGIINMAEHAAFEATLITSSRWSTAGQWYGAVRAMQVAPLSREARKDDPVVGVTIGHLFGDRHASFGPEIGVYYDRSVLGLNINRVIVVPSVVIRMDGSRRRS
jgi:hypothetical protein